MSDAPANPPGLGPHCVGRRVVVRRVLRGERGPSGGPALTDLLGVMESWSEGVTTVRAESGEVTTIAVADIVSGKPVPPRPSVRLRVSGEEAERRSNAAWPAPVAEPMGEWLLRAAGGFSSRANSVMAVGDPGMPITDAIDRVVAFYERHGLPAWAQVVVGSEVHATFESAGWVPARPGEADTFFQVASVSRALRVARDVLPPVVPSVSLGTTATPEWLAGDERALAHGDDALRVLEGPEEVVFASIAAAGRARRDPPAGRAGPGGRAGPEGRARRDPVIAKARAAYADDWAGITDVHVSQGHRRQGLAVVVMVAVLEWAAERGATTAYVQTRGDNPPALALYERLGFVTHHAYRYLTPPPS